ANRWAAKLCELGPLALRAAKKSIINGSTMPFNKGLEYESEIFSELLNTNDSKEGQKAFIEKRKPDFKAK
ncbi:MAG: enoyl-CoA hydratase-related protein, partial [Chloroflexi bacterium]|nr:enoyl-CoA hydratase-related protein [Chloroflexota bacterium]